VSHRLLFSHYTDSKGGRAERKHASFIPNLTWKRHTIPNRYPNPNANCSVKSAPHPRPSRRQDTHPNPKPNPKSYVLGSVSSVRHGALSAWKLARTGPNPNPNPNHNTNPTLTLTLTLTLTRTPFFEPNTNPNWKLPRTGLKLSLTTSPTAKEALVSLIGRYTCTETIRYAFIFLWYKYY